MESLAARVDEIQERMWKLPTDSGGYATLELWGPVAVEPGKSDPAWIASRVYHSGQVTGAKQRSRRDWTKAVKAHIRAHTIDREDARRRADSLAAELVDVVTAALGTVRLAATVDYRPSQWYAALWEDWLLAGDTSALVLHLGRDS